MKFKAEQFTPTQWETSAQKARFANQFVKLVTNGFKRQDFPKWFYSRLSMTFGHIAHYNQEGFYAYWFESKAKQVQFLQNSIKWTNYGDPAWTYSDAEKAIGLWLSTDGILTQVEKEAITEKGNAEAALVRQILANATPSRRREILEGFNI